MNFLRYIETKLENTPPLDAWGMVFVVASVAIGFFVSTLIDRFTVLSDLGFLLVMVVSVPLLWTMYNYTIALIFGRPKIHFFHVVERILYLWP